MIELIEDFDEDVTLPLDAFVFFGHQGYEYRFFLTDNDDDDPPVYRYVEGEPPKITNSLTEYFRPLVLEFIAWLEKGKS